MSRAGVGGTRGSSKQRTLPGTLILSHLLLGLENKTPSLCSSSAFLFYKSLSGMSFLRGQKPTLPRSEKFVGSYYRGFNPSGSMF